MKKKIAKRRNLSPTQVRKTFVLTVLNQLRNVNKTIYSRVQTLHLFLSTFYMEKKMEVNKTG